MSFRDALLFVSGAVCLGYGIIALYFLRFLAPDPRPLVCLFGAAFLILALERVLLAANGVEWAHKPHISVTRLIAFLIIYLGDLGQNRPSPG